MVNWRRFRPADFEYDFDAGKLAAYGVTFEEAVECFFSDFEVRQNKSYSDRFQLIGTTIGGRQLKIISQLKPNQIVGLSQDGRYENEVRATLTSGVCH